MKYGTIFLVTGFITTMFGIGGIEFMDPGAPDIDFIIAVAVAITGLSITAFGVSKLQ